MENQWGLCLALMGRSEEAEQHYLQSLDLIRKVQYPPASTCRPTWVDWSTCMMTGVGAKRPASFWSSSDVPPPAPKSASLITSPGSVSPGSRRDYDAAEPLLASAWKSARGHSPTTGRGSTAKAGSSLPAGPEEIRQRRAPAISGYEGLKTREARIPAVDKDQLGEAGMRLLQLYETWGKPEKVTQWRVKLGLADLPDDPFAP